MSEPVFHEHPADPVVEAQSSLPFISVENPRYIVPTKTLIACDVVLRGHENLGKVLFVADPQDKEVYCRTLFNQCLQGKHGVVAEYVAPPPRK